MSDAISSVTSAASATSSNYSTESSSSLDKNAFLQLMIEQLKNQDPLDPLDGTDYAAQLAQFTSLEQLSNINDNLGTSINANYLLAQSVNNSMSATLIGKNAKIDTDTITYQGKGQDKVSVGYDLPSDAKNLKVVIKNEAGTEIKTFDDLDTSEGTYKLDWDFTDDNGEKVSAGDYTVEISADTTSGSDMSVTQYLIGAISSVKFDSSGSSSLVIDGVGYSTSDIFEILQGE